MENKLSRKDNKSNGGGPLNNVDSLRSSELEVENEKLRHDYQLLRNSIKRGVEGQELEGEFQMLEL